MDINLEQLQAELNTLQPGTDPATPESLSRIGQYVRDMQVDMDAIPAEQRKTQNYKIAEHCLNALKEEWECQNRKLVLDGMLTDLLRSVIQLRESLIDGQKVIDSTADLNVGIGRKFFKFYSDILTPAINKCLNSEVGDILKVPLA
jgi:hypothetical protein